MAGQKPGSIGQYFEGHIGDGGRQLKIEVCASVCAHCQNITEFPSMRKMTDFIDVCRGCMRLICPKCASGPCDPIEAKIERMELQAKLERQAWRCY